MDNLKVVEYNGTRVLTTTQLAEAYGTDNKTLSYNFNYNRDRSIEGKHYICLVGDDLKAFREIHDLPQNVNKVLLWTEKGCFLAAKSLNTDQAWDAYDRLIDGYFTIRQELVDRSSLSPQMQMFYAIADAQAKQELEQKRIAAELKQNTERMDKIERKIDATAQALEPIHQETWRKDVTKKFNRVQKASEIPWEELYVEMYKELDRRAGVDTARRLMNRRERMRVDGISQTNIRKVTRMDIIQEDKKLRAIFERILSEYEIKYCDE